MPNSLTKCLVNWDERQFPTNEHEKHLEHISDNRKKKHNLLNTNGNYYLIYFFDTLRIL